MEAVWRAAQKAAAGEYKEDGELPVTEVPSFKPLIRKGTRSLTANSTGTGNSRNSAHSGGTQQGSVRNSRNSTHRNSTHSVEQKTPALVRGLTGGLMMLTKGKSGDFGGGGLGGFLTKQFTKGSLGDRKNKPRICLDELRETIQKNLAEEPALTLFDYYKDEGCWQLIARSALFENVTLFVIAINAIWMAVDTNWNKAPSLVEAEPVFIIAENLFCTYFTAEWLIRFMSFERKIWGLNDNWFMFDTALVTMMVLETWVAVAIVLILNDDGFSLGDVAILRLFRLMRLSRLVRMLRALPELLILVKGALRAMRTVAFVISLLLAITYVFGVAMVLLLKGTSTGDEMFSTVPHAIYSLLLYGTLLDNLAVVCAKLEQCSIIGLVVFFIYIALAALTVLNMLIGVLCEMVSMVAHQEKDEMLKTRAEEKLSMVIKELDQDDDMQLSKKEFLDILVNPTAAQALADIGVDPIGVIDFAELIFSNEMGQEAELSFEEFMEVILQLRGSNSSTVRHMVELKHMIAQQLDDLTKDVQEYQAKMDMTGSFSPDSFRLQPLEKQGGVDRFRRDSESNSALTASSRRAPRASADTFVMVDSARESEVLPSDDRPAGYFHRVSDKVQSPPRMFVKVEQAPDVPPLRMEAAASRVESPPPLLTLDSFEGQSGSPISQGSSVVSSPCPFEPDGPDVSEELSTLQSRTQRMEDTMVEVLAAVQKLSAQFAADGSPRGDALSDDEQLPLADTLGLPGVPVPATPLGR
jgi:voltage-gated sodium channel